MKTTWKWVPVARYHISAAERWLDKMAAKGLLLLSLEGPLAKFEVGEPRPGRRYRLAVDPDYFKRPPEPMLELYEDSGWQFAAPIWGRSFFVFYSDDPGAVEPYTDEQSRANSLAQVVRIIRKELFHFLFVFLFFVSTRYVLSGPITPSLYTWLFFLFFLGSILLILSVTQNLFTILRMKRWLEKGRPLHTFAPPVTQLAVQTITWAMWSLMLLLAVLLLPIDMLHLDNRIMPLDQAPQELELLLLADMEDPGYVPDRFEWIGGFDGQFDTAAWAHRNYVQRLWLPFIPAQYNISQSGVTGDGAEVQLDIHRYNALTANQAEKKFTELAGEGVYYKILVPGTERFGVSESGDQVCARLGRRVIQVTYSGSQDFTEYYDEIVDMLQAEK